jgi:iron complex transport system substrate-binding protein
LFKLVCGVLAVLMCAPARGAGVVSLNLCTDELLVLLAPERVAALSPLARDASLSVVAAAADKLPWVRADAEAVLRLHPDLVLAGDYGAQGVVAALRERGVRVVQVSEPTDFAGVDKQVLLVAAALGVPGKGAAMLANMRARLAAVGMRDRGRAVMWEARGFSAGPGGFGDAVLRAAGYRNVGTGAEMGVEALAAHPPDVLITNTAPDYPSLSTDLLWHPALRGLHRREVPPALLACAGPWSVGAVEALAR